MSSNIVTAAFGASRSARTRALHQWDYGQILQFVGLNLPDTYTVHFSNVGVGGTAKTMLGNADGVDIPDEYLTTGQPVYAWVFLHTGEDDGETMYSVIIPVTARSKPVEEEPTPVQQGLIDQAIAALNAGVKAAEGAAQDAEQIATDLGDFETAIAAATAAKEAAEQSEDDAAGSASAAGTAQAAAQAAAGAATSARDAAVAAQSGAESSAQAAAGSATAAAGSAAAAAASEAAAREVEESIPEDYADLSADVVDLKSKMDKVENCFIEVQVGGEQVTLTNAESITDFSNNGSMMGGSLVDGVRTYAPSTVATEKNPYVRHQCELGTKKWLVGFKFKVNKLSQTVGDPLKFAVFLGTNATNIDFEWGKWIDFYKVVETNLTRIYIQVKGFETAPTQYDISLELKDIYAYDVAEVSDDLITLIETQQTANYQDGTVTYGEGSVTTYLPDVSLEVAGKSADSKAVGDKFKELYVTATNTLVNAVSLNNMAAYTGLNRDSITSGIATYTPSGTPDNSPSVRDYCNLGTGNRIVSLKYKITKNDQSIGDPQYIRLFVGNEEHRYSVRYDEWCYVQLFTSVNLTRVYLILNGYSAAPTSGQITLQVKDYYVYDISDITGEMLFQVISRQRTDYKDGSVSYSVAYLADKTDGIINAKEYGVKGDGVSDDTDTINALLKSFNGIIYFPSGTYNISGTIEVGRNTVLYGNGDDTVFSMTRFNSLDMINSRVAYIRPYILVRSDNVTVKNIKIVGNTDYIEQFHWGLAIIGAANCLVSNVTVLNVNCNFNEAVNDCKGYGISAMNCSFVVIEKCNVQNCGYECIGFFDGNDHGIVRDCYTKDGKRTCIQVHRDNSDIFVQNNHMKQTHDKYDSCLVIHGLAGGTEIYNLRIENNTMEMTQDGTQSESYCAPAQIMSDVHGCWFISNNIFGGKRALYVSGSIHDCSIIGNVMQCNDQSDYGITCASSQAIITGNRIYNEAETGNSISQNPVMACNIGIS